MSIIFKEKKYETCMKTVCSYFEGGWIANIHVSLMVFKQNFDALSPTSIFY